MRYFHFRAQEQVPPDDLLRRAVEAERSAIAVYGREFLPKLAAGS